MLTRKTKLWIFISATSVILASAAAVVFTKPGLFQGLVSSEDFVTTPPKITIPPTVYEKVNLSGEGINTITQFTATDRAAKKIGNIKFVEGEPISEKKLKRLVITMKQCNNNTCSSFKTPPDTATGSISLRVGGATLNLPRLVSAGGTAIFDNLHLDANAFTVPDFEQTPRSVDIWFTPHPTFPFTKYFQFGIYGLSYGSRDEQPVAFAYFDQNVPASTKAYCRPGCADENNFIIGKVGPAVSGGVAPKNIIVNGGGADVVTYDRAIEKKVSSFALSATELQADRTKPTLNELTIKVKCAGCETFLSSAGGNFRLRANDSFSPAQTLLASPSSSHSVTFRNLSAVMEQDRVTPAFAIPKYPGDLLIDVYFRPSLGFPRDKNFSFEVSRPDTEIKVVREPYIIQVPDPPFQLGGIRFVSSPALSGISIPTSGLPTGNEVSVALPSPSPAPTPPQIIPPQISITLDGEDRDPIPLNINIDREQKIGTIRISETGAPLSPIPSLNRVTFKLMCRNCPDVDDSLATGEVRIQSSTGSSPSLLINNRISASLSGLATPGFAADIRRAPLTTTFDIYFKPLGGFPTNKAYLLLLENVSRDITFLNAPGATVTHTHIASNSHPAISFLIGDMQVAEAPGADGPARDPVTPIGSEIHVRRSIDTPVAASFRPGAQGNVFKVRAFVPSGEAEIESITFSKFGTTRNRDFDEIRLYEGDHRFELGIQKVLGEVEGVPNTGYVNFRVDRILRAGETATFTLWMKLESDALIDSTFYFSVPHPDEVTPADNSDIVILEDRNGNRCVGDDPNCVRSENFIVAREEVAYVPPDHPEVICPVWECGEWNMCSASGIQRRSCTQRMQLGIPGCPQSPPSPATSQSCTPDEEPGPTLSGLTCEQQSLFTYTGEERSDRTPGMCIPCRTNLYVATGGTCDLGIGDEEPPAEEEPAPAPTLQSAPRIVQAPERSDSGPGVLVYFAAMGAANLALYLKKRKKK